MRKSFLIKYLGDNPKIRILDFLIDNFAMDFSLTQIAKESNVAYARKTTVFRHAKNREIFEHTTLIEILPGLIKQGIVIKTRKIGKSGLYQLDLDNPIAKALLAIDMKLSEAALVKEKEEVFA